MLETDALHGVSELDIDAKVVRVEFEFVTFGECLVFLNIHRERSDVSGNL